MQGIHPVRNSGLKTKKMLRKKHQNQTGNYPLSRFTKCNSDCTPRLNSLTLYTLKIQRKIHQPLIIKLCIIKSIWGKIHIANIHVRASIIFRVWSYNPWREHKSSVWSLNYLCFFLYLSLSLSISISISATITHTVF